MATVSNQPNSHYYPQNQNDALGPRKTIIVLATVVLCIAVLWTQMFYPMLFGSSNVPIKNNFKDIKAGCCGVLLDHEKYANVTQPAGQSGYRQKSWNLNLMTDEISLRQERPSHLRGDHIHPAMIERGRAIPNTQTVPIVSGRPLRASDNIQYIDGRPGPVPGLRPPMGAGSVHQANQKGNTMGLLMPMYTFGIVAFAVYTIMKLVMRKSDSMDPYPTPKDDETFRNEVFRRDNNKIPNLDWKHHDTIVTAIQGLIDAADEQLNKRENSEDSNKDATDETKDKHSEKSNGQLTNSENYANDNSTTEITSKRCRDSSAEKELKVLGLEMTVSCENGKKWTRPTTPNLIFPHGHHNPNESEPEPEPQSIYLEGALPHESQILVSDSKTITDGVYNEDVNGNSDEPAVILSSKMTLSLINLDPVNNENGGENSSNGASDHEIEDIEYEEDEDDDAIEEEEEDEEDEDDEDDENSDDEQKIENIHGVAT